MKKQTKNIDGAGVISSKESDISVSTITRLLSNMEPPNVAQARPPIVTSVSAAVLQNFVTSYKNYWQLGGIQSARSFLHSSVIQFFATVLSVDLSAERFEDSNMVLQEIQRHYAPTRFDYINLLQDVAMKAKDLDMFDKDAVNDYIMRFLTCLSDHPAIISEVEADVIADTFFAGVLPLSLRMACKKQKIKDHVLLWLLKSWAFVVIEQWWLTN